MSLLRYRIGRFLRAALPRRWMVRLERASKRTARRADARRRAALIEQYGTFDTDELVARLSVEGVRTGSVLLVQSAFGKLYTYSGTAPELLEGLIEICGDEGTLLMPAHPPRARGDRPAVFDVRRTPAATGLLAELFRRHEGVQRSLHPTHSVSARGPLAAELLEGHHLAERSCGPATPYARLVEHEAQILGLGLPAGHTTFFHVVEDSGEGYPLETHEREPERFVIVDEEGGRHELFLRRRDPRVMASMDLRRVTDHLTPKALRSFDIRGVPCFIANARPLYDELSTLARQGVVIYA